MITIRDIARECKVSTSTVSKAINNYPTIPESTKKRIKEVIERMGYVPNAAAAGLSRGSSCNVGILGFLKDGESPFTHPMFSSILSTFQLEMNKAGYDLLFIDKLIHGKKGSFLLNCSSRSVSGVLLFGALRDEGVQEVINSDIPCVGFDYYDDKITSVQTNNEKAMFDLTNHLISLGHKNIVFIAGEENSAVTNIRVKGFKKAMNNARLPINDFTIKYVQYFDYEGVKKETINILKNHKEVTAIMYSDDLSAYAGLKEIKALGKRVPEDISITGFDGISIGDLLPLQVTSMRQNIAEIGSKLAQELILLIKNKDVSVKQIKVDATLVEGNSVRKI